mgnify:CR=1 FL=1
MTERVMVREMVHEKVRGTAPETELSTVRGLELSMEPLMVLWTVLSMELSMGP